MTEYVIHCKCNDCGYKFIIEFEVVNKCPKCQSKNIVLDEKK